MTKSELSQLFYLNREIEREQERLASLEEAATDTSVKISGMPFVGGMSDKTAIAAEIADAKAIIKAKQIAAVAEYNRLIRYINSVNDSFIRQILGLRYIDGKSWQGIANEIGGNTADSIRMAHNRFLRKN